MNWRVCARKTNLLTILGTLRFSVCWSKEFPRQTRFGDCFESSRRIWTVRLYLKWVLSRNSIIRWMKTENFAVSLMVQHARLFFRHWRSHFAFISTKQLFMTWHERACLFDNSIHLPFSLLCVFWTNYGLNIDNEQMETQPWTLNAFSTTWFTVDFTINCWIFSFLICQNKWL